jgi:hypothetical protein
VSHIGALERIGEDDPDEEDFDFARQICASVVASMVRVNFIPCHFRVVGREPPLYTRRSFTGH